MVRSVAVFCSFVSLLCVRAFTTLFFAARLLYLLGVKQLIVCVSKMDDKSAQYKEERYNHIAAEVKLMLTQVRARCLQSGSHSFGVLVSVRLAGRRLTLTIACL